MSESRSHLLAICISCHSKASNWVTPSIAFTAGASGQIATAPASSIPHSEPRTQRGHARGFRQCSESGVKKRDKRPDEAVCRHDSTALRAPGRIRGHVRRRPPLCAAHAQDLRRCSLTWRFRPAGSTLARRSLRSFGATRRKAQARQSFRQAPRKDQASGRRRTAGGFDPRRHACTGTQTSSRSM